MTAPTTTPVWDSNATNTAPITSGHKTDGWALNESIASAELNTLINLQGQWIAWLDSTVTAPGWRWIAATEAIVFGASPVIQNIGFIQANATGANSPALVPVQCKPGDVIDGLGIVSLGDTDDTIEVILLEMAGDGTTNVLGSILRVTQPATWSEVTASIAPHVVVDGRPLFLSIAFSALSASAKIQSVGYHLAPGTP